MASGRERRTPAPRWHTDLFDLARQARAGNVQVMLSCLSVAEAALSVPDDDHPVVRTGGRRLLEQAGGIDVVAEAGAAFVAQRPDLLVTDLTMAGSGGLAPTRRRLARAWEPCARLPDEGDFIRRHEEKPWRGHSGGVCPSAGPAPLDRGDRRMTLAAVRSTAIEDRTREVE